MVLDSLIRGAAREAELAKSEAGCLLASEIQNKMFTMAFDHYKGDLEKPFDFLESLYMVRPLEDRLSANFFAFLKSAVSAYLSLSTGASEHEFSPVITPALCSMIALDHCRSDDKHPGRLRDIYKGRTINSQSIGDGESAAVAYQSQVAEATGKFLDQVCPCEFVHPDGRACVNFRLAHDKVFQHQDSTGELIGFGTFESAFVDELTLSWNNEIDKSFDELDDHQRNSDAVVQPGTQLNAESMITWSSHCIILQRLYSKIPNIGVRDIKTCSWCLKDEQLELLSCGHRIYWKCTEMVGDSPTNAIEEGSFVIRSCDLHEQTFHFETPKYIIKVHNTGPIVLR